MSTTRLKRRKRKRSSSSESDDESSENDTPLADRSSYLQSLQKTIKLRDQGKLDKNGGDGEFFAADQPTDDGERKRGNWTLEEDMDLYEACEAYLEEKHLDAVLDMRKLVHQKLGGQAWAWIANYLGGKRSAFQIRDRVILAFHEHRDQDEWTPEVDKQITKLAAEYEHLAGNGKWVKIAKLLQRRPYDVRYRWFQLRQQSGSMREGTWTPDEEIELLRLIREANGGEIPDKNTKISWLPIATRLNRMYSSVRSKWMSLDPNRVASPLSTQSRVLWTQDDDLILLLKVSILRPLRERDVTFSLLSKTWCASSLYYFFATALIRPFRRADDIYRHWKQIKKSAPSTTESQGYPAFLYTLRKKHGLTKQRRAELEKRYRLDEW